MKNKWQMIADPSKCRVCWMCKLICSLKQNKTFNPSIAFINVTSTIKPSGELDVGISFKDGCDSCGLCAKYCVYGALSREKLAIEASA